jgi:peptidoglycan/xylan/chitin deacetylase (PgdA/CDA1 family)
MQEGAGAKVAIDPSGPRRPVAGPRRLHGLALLGLLAVLAGPAKAEKVALTFDDLPTLTLAPDLDYTAATTKALLAGLRRRRWPATGFVNEGKLEGPEKQQRIALLSAWLDAGMDLGNHGYAHLSLTTTPVGAYIADAVRGEEVTRALLAARGRTLSWWRYPYLETGTTTETRRTFEDWLGAHGYRVAPVTMENADWMFALVYDDAILRKDRAKAERVRLAYLAYTAKVVPWYRQAALALLGRRPAFVFLLHASRLNADSLKGLARILAANDLRPVSLEDAMADPAYAIADAYTGPDGEEWISRWAQTLGKGLAWESFPEPPRDIAAEDARLDGAPG